MERLTLARAVTLALERNTELSLARGEQGRAAAQEREALGLALPDLTLSGRYQREGKNPELEFFGQRFRLKPDESYAVNAELNQYLYSGAVSAGWRAAQRATAAAGQGLEAARQDAIAQVAQRFYLALYAREVIRAHEESVAQLEEHLKDSREREAVGLNTSYDTLRFESRLAEARPELLAARNDYARVSLALLDLAGLDPLAQVEFDGALPLASRDTPLDEAVAAALARRPELAAAGERVEVADRIADATASEQLPSVQAFARYSASNNPGLGDVNQWLDDWNVGLKLEMNLFDGRERSSRLERRRVEAQMERDRREAARRRVVIETREAHDELARAAQFVRSQEKSVEYAQETYRIARAAREEGMVTQLELLDAQLALTRARINYHRSLYERAVAGIKLRRAMGVMDENVE